MLYRISIAWSYYESEEAPSSYRFETDVERDAFRRGVAAVCGHPGSFQLAEDEQARTVSVRWQDGTTDTHTFFYAPARIGFRFGVEQAIMPSSYRIVDTWETPDDGQSSVTATPYSPAPDALA